MAEDGLVASVCANGVTKILRAADGHELATLNTGFGSDGVIYDQVHKLLLVPAAKGGTLSVIALSADKPPALVQTVKTGQGARLGVKTKAAALGFADLDVGAKPDAKRMITSTARQPL